MKVRYYGHAHLPTGYGRAALDLAFALDRAGVVIEVVTMGPRPDDVPWPLPPHMTRPVEDPDVVIVHTLPGDCHKVLETEGLKRGAGPKLVAYTTWETLTAPAAICGPLYGAFDEVWVPSQPTASALGEHGDHGEALWRGASFGCRTRVIPHCFDELAPRPSIERDEGERFRFYWIGNWTARKNPAGLVRAFARAFTAADPVEMVLHSPGASIETFIATMAQTGIDQAELPKMSLSNHRLDARLVAEMHHHADCFVSAARGEAWNLPAFDALLAGRHVITQYGLGSDEFLLNTSADLIDGTESPAQVDVKFAETSNGETRITTIGAQGLSSRSLWLEPNLSSMADSMRDAQQNLRRSLKIDYDVAGRFGYAAVANLVMNVLENKC